MREALEELALSQVGPDTLLCHQYTSRTRLVLAMGGVKLS